MQNSDLKAILVRLVSSGTMESNGGNSSSHENQPSGGSNNSSKEKPTEKEIFVNHGMPIEGKLLFVIFLHSLLSRTVRSVISLSLEQAIWDIVELIQKLTFSMCMLR